MGFASNMKFSLDANRALRKGRNKLKDISLVHAVEKEELLTEEQRAVNKKAFSDYSKQLEAEAHKKNWVKPVTGILLAMVSTTLLVLFLMEV